MLHRVLSGLLGRFFEEDLVVEEGKITAKNATLRPEGVKSFGFPAALHRGKVGLLALRITNEGSRVHAHVEVRDLLLVLGQKEEGSDESRAERSRAQIVANLINDTKSRIASILESAGDDSTLSWWRGALLFGRLLSSITIAVDGIHVRYEDAVSNPAEPISVGLCISKITLNDSGEEKGIKHRRLAVEGVQLYRQTGALDSESVSVPHAAQIILESTQLSAALAFAPEHEDASTASTVYLQSATCETGALKLSVDPSTVRDLSSLAAVMEHRSPLILYISRRPAVAYKGNAKAWWAYALSCVGEIVRRERVARSPQAVSVRIQDLLAYARLYSAYLARCVAAVCDNSNAPPEAEEERLKREDLETGLPRQTVMAIRDTVQRQTQAASASNGEAAATPSASTAAGEAGGARASAWWRMTWMQLGWGSAVAGAGELVLEAAALLMGDADPTDPTREESSGRGVAGERKVQWKVPSVEVELWDAKRRNGTASGPTSKIVSMAVSGVAGSCVGDGTAVKCVLDVAALQLDHHGSPAPVEPLIVSRSPEADPDAPHLLHVEWGVRPRPETGALAVSLLVRVERMELVNSPPLHAALLPFRAHWDANAPPSPPFFATNHTQHGDARWWRVLARWMQRPPIAKQHTIDVDIRAHLPDIVVPATCEFRDRTSSLLVGRPGSLTLRTTQTADSDTAGVTFGVEGACVVACTRSDDWRGALAQALLESQLADVGDEGGGEAGAIDSSALNPAPLMLLLPVSVHANIAPAEPGQQAWSSLKAPVAVRQVVVDCTKEKLSRALECLVYAFAHRASTETFAPAQSSTDGGPLSLSGLLSECAPMPVLRALSTLVSSSSANKIKTGWAVSVEVERLLLLLKDADMDLATLDVGRVWAGATWSAGTLSARLGVRSIALQDCQGTMHGAPGSRVQLLSCQSASTAAASSEEDGWDGLASGFLAMALDVVPDEEDAESAKRVSSRLRAGCVHVGLSLAAVARLQHFITTVVASSLPGAKSSVASRLRAAAPARSGVLYSARHAQHAAAPTTAMLWSVSASLSSLVLSILVPHSSFAVAKHSVPTDTASGEPEEMSEVASFEALDLALKRARTRQFAEEWSCQLGGVKLTGAREVCGDHSKLLEMPCASTAAEAEGARAPAIYACRRVRDVRWRRLERVSEPAGEAGLEVRTAAFEGVVLMRLVTFVATSVTQSEMYISNSQRVVAAAVDLAAKAKSRASELLYNQERERVSIELARGTLHMPCDRKAGADRVLVISEPLSISNATEEPASGSADVVSLAARLSVETELDGERSQVLVVAATTKVERQLKLDRLDPSIPRVRVSISAAEVRAGVGQAQLGLLYRIVRWNSGQAEEARRAAALAARKTPHPSILDGNSAKSAEGAGPGRVGGSSVAGVLDRRRVGIRVVDWVVEVETAGLTMSLREPDGEGGLGPAEASAGVSASASNTAQPQPQPQPHDSSSSSKSSSLRDIFEFHVGAVRARMERWSDTVSKGELVLECVRLSDLGPLSHTQFRNIIGPRTGNAPFLRATLDSDGDGETHRVNVHCASQEANFAPGPLLRVATFLLSSSLVDAAQITELSHPEVVAVGESSTSLAMPRWRRRVLSLMMRPLEQDGVLDLHFQVAPCQVVVWEDSSKEDSAHTFLRFDAVATYLASLREHTTKIAVGGIEAAVRTSARGGESSILSGLTLSYDAIRKHEAILEIKEKISISKLQLTVGYQDVKGVLLIGSQWAEQARTSGMMEAHGALQILQAAKRAASAAAQRVVEGIQHRAGLPAPTSGSGGSGEAAGGGGGSAKEIRPLEAAKDAAAVPGAVVEQRRSHLLVSEQVRVCIVNDCVGFNVPLSELILAPFSIATTSGAGGKGLTSRGQLRLEASFYNILSSAFEPVLEPIKFDVTSDLYVDAAGAHNFAVTSKQRLELNLSEMHVCSFLSTLEAWSQDLYPHIKLEDAADLLRARGSKIWPYTLRNETGCPLRFWAGRSTEPLEGGEVHSMDKEGEKPFAFAKTAAAGTSAPTLELHCISVVVEGAAGAVTGVPVDNVGVHMFALDDGQALIVEVTVGEGGGKVIAVQSVVKLCNHTDLTMEIAVVTRQGNPVWLESLAPEKHFCLPTHLRECYAVLVRPVGEDAVSFQWSERVLLPFRSQPSSVDWSLVTCSTTPDPQGLDPSRKCFQVRVDAKKPLNPEESAASCIRAVLSVHPILRISNALPVRASFSVLSADVQDRSEHVLFEKDVDAAKQLYLYSVDKKTALGLIVNVPGLDRVRQPALIYHPQPEGQDLSDRIELVDEWGANLVLGLEHETNAWGDVTVVVYALYEIHNHSGLSLFYGQEGWDVVGLPAPKLAAGQDPSATAVQAKSLLENMLGMGADKTRAPEREGQAMLDADAAQAQAGGESESTELERQLAPFVFSTEGEGVTAGRLCVSVGGGEWSKPLSLDGLGSSGGGVLELSLPGGNAYGPKPLIELAAQLTSGGRRLERGKILHLHPRFVVVNTSDHVLQVAQAGLEKYYALGLAAQARRVFHWGDASGARCVRMRVCGERGEDDVMIGGWSGAVTLDAEGSFALRVPSVGGGFLNLKADVRVVGAATRLFIAAESERHPSYLVRNDMPAGTVHVQQVGGSPQYAIEVEAGRSAVLCWEEPLESHQVTVTHAGSGSVQVQLDDLGVSGWNMGHAQVAVSARGPTRLLRVALTHEEERDNKEADKEEASLAGVPGVPRGSALVRSSLAVNLGGVGVSLLDGGLEELLYLSLTQVRAQYTLGFDDVSWEVKVGRVQVDNQTDVGAPVVLHRVVRGDASTPMLHVSVVRQIDASLKWYQYVAVSLQEVRLAIHETILVRLAGVVQSIVNASSLIKTPKDLKDARLLRWLKGKGSSHSSHLSSSHASSSHAGADDLLPPKERRLYIDALHLHPLLLHVAFTPTGEIADRYHQRQQTQGGGGSGGTAANMLSFVRGLNMSFPSVEGTPLALNALILNRFFGSGSELRSCVWQHYKQHLKRQLYMSWAPGGSALSNPSASINRVATDARDLFYDPAQALVRSPTDLKDAFRNGGVHVARSLHGGAVTFGQISRSVSKALSQLAMDEEAPGHAGAARSEAANAQEAFSEGALEFRRTLDEAAAGILKKPLQALESEGVGGFLAGLGKGLLGGVMKPTAGMLDLAAKTSDGFVNAANDTSSEFAGRVRPPRTTPLDGTLRIFDARAATGADVLRRVNAGAYRRELFVAYAQLQGMEAVLVTDKRLVVMEVCTLEVRFKVKMSEISSVRTQGSGVMVAMKSAASQGIKFYTEALGVSSPKPDRHLSCGDLDTAEWLVSSIMACCQAAAAEDSR